MEISPVLLSVCGITLVVIVLVFLVALLLLRVARASVFGFASMLVRMLVEPREEPDTRSTAARAETPRPSGRDLRAQIHAQDFDAAVAQHSQDQPAAQTVRPTTRPASPPPTSPPDSPPTLPADDDAFARSERRRTRRRQEDDEDDMDFMGSLLG